MKLRFQADGCRSSGQIRVAKPKETPNQRAYDLACHYPEEVTTQIFRAFTGRRAVVEDDRDVGTRLIRNYLELGSLKIKPTHLKNVGSFLIFKLNIQLVRAFPFYDG